jgi:hypothetical protein
MPSSRVLISSQTLGSAAASVTFSSIPATYTDLVLKASIRGADSVNQRPLQMEFNANSSLIYSVTSLEGDGSTAYSSQSSGTDSTRETTVNANSSTANTFSSMEVYIPSYTVSQNKPFSFFTAMETNATTAYMNVTADLFRSTAAISQILIRLGAGNIIAGSSFYLYGLRSS